MMFICPVSGGVNFDPLVKVAVLVSYMYLHLSLLFSLPPSITFPTLTLLPPSYKKPCDYPG